MVWVGSQVRQGGRTNDEKHELAAHQLPQGGLSGSIGAAPRYLLLASQVQGCPTTTQIQEADVVCCCQPPHAPFNYPVRRQSHLTSWTL